MGLRAANFQISTVSTPYGGHIGITQCPGRKYPPALGTGFEQSLLRDVRAIRDFPAAILVTLMEMGELDWAGPALPELSAVCAHHGMRHLYMPIVDQDIPDIHWEQRWLTHGPELHDLLRGGSNIVFHCRGGRGRAGLAATRVLIETGEDPVSAMARVRMARPGAIETLGQEAYLLGLGVKF